MAKLLTILLVALVVEAVGVVFLSQGIKQIAGTPQLRLPEIAGLVRRGVTNRSILVGVALEAAFFAALLYLLSQKDVTVVWPLTALGFVITTLMARAILHEHVSPLRWAGVTLIVLGAMLVTWSDQPKSPRPPPSPPSAAAQPGGELGTPP